MSGSMFFGASFDDVLKAVGVFEHIFNRKQ